MTTELEKQFFDTFGIEKKQRKACVDENILCPTPKKECEECSYFQYIHDYPQITDRHYLELICILGYFETVYNPNNCEELKKYILDYYLNLDDSEIRELKHQVQAIFEGER